MKTQSIKSIATLLGVAVVLNVSALAGPGPQPQPARRINEVSDQKNVVLVATRQDDGKSVKPMTQSPSFHVGTHGGIAIR